jgi:hypothetical protein
VHQLHISANFTLLEREAGHIIVLMVLIWWGCRLMAMHVDFGKRLADQATGALFYALNVRKP